LWTAILIELFKKKLRRKYKHNKSKKKVSFEENKKNFLIKYKNTHKFQK